MRRQKLVSKQTRSLFPNGYRVMQGKQEFVTYREDATIRVWHRERPDAFALHWHTAAEILIVVRGGCLSETSESSFLVGPGEILITPPRCPHTLSMAEDSERYLILFETDMLERMRDFAATLKRQTRPVHVCAQLAQESGMLDLLYQVVSVYRFREPMWNMTCYSLLLLLLAKLCARDAVDGAQGELPPDRRLAASPQVMEGVLRYIDQNCAGDIKLERMAAYSGYSKWYFSRVFKQYTGVPFMQYLTQARVANIRQALISDTASVAEICARSGFSSTSTFNRVFKEMNGCTPSEYRSIYGKRAQGEGAGEA